MNTTPAERRERYKAAMRNVRMLRDGKNQDRQADAVIAVADQELTQVREELEDANGDIAEMQRDIARLRTHAAEVRATALSEAADDLEAIDFHPNARGNYRGIAKAFAFRLRAKAAAARPDNTGA